MLKKGDNIYLLRRNIKTKRLSDKLDYKKLRLFEIKNIIRIVNYKLKLLKIIRIYLVFYIALLELAPEGTLLVLYIEVDQLDLE